MGRLRRGEWGLLWERRMIKCMAVCVERKCVGENKAKPLLRTKASEQKSNTEAAAKTTESEQTQQREQTQTERRIAGDKSNLLLIERTEK